MNVAHIVALVCLAMLAGVGLLCVCMSAGWISVRLAFEV